jgi:tetratricopeptide (TPR) repeat protein
VNGLNSLKGVWSAVISTLIVILIALFGCVPPAQKAEVEISPERQKAIQDSLRKIYEYELNKAWSTGYEHYKNKIYRNAVKPFWKVVEIDTINRFKDIYSLLADSYNQLGLPDSAQLVYELGIKQYPDNVHLHQSLGYILAAKEETDRAIEEYEKVVELSPEKVEVYKILANLYVKNDQLEDAIDAYEKVVELDPQDKSAQQTLAQLYRTTGQEDAALERMEKALELDPENTKLMSTLGKAYYDRGENTKAIVKLKTLLKHTPDDVLAMEYLGGALQNEQKYREAIKTYKRIIELKPDHKKVLTDIATCYKELGDFPIARSYTQKALKIDPKYGLAFIVLGEVYETAVEKCMDQRAKPRPEFDDKLVYKLAYEQYEKAKADLEWKETAERRMNYLQDLIPKKEDYFFHKGQDKPKAECYQWIYK